VREYIFAGDVMQVVPSQRMSVEFKAPPLDPPPVQRSRHPMH